MVAAMVPGETGVEPAAAVAEASWMSVPLGLATAVLAGA